MMEAGLINQQVVQSPEAYGFPLSQYKVVRALPSAVNTHIAQKSAVPPNLGQFDPSGKS